MHAVEIRYHQVLSTLLRQTIAEKLAHLGKGLGVSDWGDYKQRVGVIEGLELAITLANHLADEAKGRERDMEKLKETYS